MHSSPVSLTEEESGFRRSLPATQQKWYSRNCNDKREKTKNWRIEGLKIHKPEITCVNLEQPRRLNIQIDQTAVESTRQGDEDDRSNGNWNDNAVNLSGLTK